MARALSGTFKYKTGNTIHQPSEVRLELEAEAPLWRGVGPKTVYLSAHT